MRTMTGAMSTAVAADVRLPGYFVEIGFSTALRMSSRGVITWDSKTWTAYDVSVENFGVDAGGSVVTASVTIGNSAKTVSNDVMLYGVIDRTAKVWQFYGNTPALADPVLLFTGTVSAFNIASDVSVRLSLTTNASAVYCPRSYIDSGSGFNFLPASDQYIWFHAQKYKLIAER